MAKVGIRKAIRYGFTLLGYFAVIFIGGGIIVFIGALVSAAGPSAGGVGGTLLVLVGGLLTLIGALVIYAGLLGTGYKVIADGVTLGIENSSGFGATEDEQNRNALERRDRGGPERSGADRSGADRKDRSQSE